VATFKWGIFGTGAISAKFISGLAAARDAEASFVASRALSTAKAFAANMGVAGAVEGYAEAARAGGVDAIYIGTPASEHAAHALLCIEAGVPVLVEKPLAMNAAEAQRIADAARANGVFVMEAMWTRFLPAAQALKARMEQGAIGEVRMVSGSFGSAKQVDPESNGFNPARGGGAMAQLGVYPVSLAQWLFGEPTLVQATGTMGETGVDEDAAFQLRFANGVTGTFYASSRAWTPNDFQVMGTNGILGFQGPIYRPSGLTVMTKPPVRTGKPSFGWRFRLREHDLFHRVAQTIGWSDRNRGKASLLPYPGNGYSAEADEVRQCVQAGALESTIMPLDDSIAVARVVDEIRAAIVAGGTARGPLK